MKRFNAIKSGNVIGDGSRNALLKWLEHFVLATHPVNGIEYWSDFDRKGDDPVGKVGGDDGILYFPCYVRTGRSEGRILEIDALYRDKRFERLITIKSFGSSSECWSIASAISDALESIYQYHEIPELVEMHTSLPRRHRWEREPHLRGPLLMSRGPTSLSLSNDGKVFWERTVDKQPEVAKYYLDALQTDWRILLGSLQINPVEMDLTQSESLEAVGA